MVVKTSYTSTYSNSLCEPTRAEERRKTVFLWEGVTLYLGEDEVRMTLRGVREHAASESVLVAPFSLPSAFGAAA